ncbi:MAG: thermonuclease family protein [Syntrophorhabdaceae bacterium]|nr:thermonuclease family protein [Syntrophorhabdaceae bacterium]
MKKVSTLIILFLLLISPHLFAKEKEYIVKKVIDGDTIQLDNNEIVRYIGIDAPEMATKDKGPEFFAREAMRYNKKLVFMKNVRLEFDIEKRDQHGRLLAYVYVKNLFVNGELVRLGYAKAMIKPPNVKYKDLLLNYQKKAMEEERGLWQEKKKETESTYIGNKRTYIIHRPSCKLAEKVSEKNRIIFRSRMDAIKIGYTPCRTCKP